MTLECTICDTEKSTFQSCRQCNHCICIDCYALLTRKRCPYCRLYYVEELDSETEFEVSYVPYQVTRAQHRRNERVQLDSESESSVEWIGDRPGTAQLHRYLDQYLNGELLLDEFVELLSPSII